MESGGDSSFGNILGSDKTKVESVLSCSSTAGEVTVGVEVLLSAARASALVVRFVTGSVNVHLLAQLLDIHHGHHQLWQDLLLGRAGGLNHDVGAVMVVLVGGPGCPGEGEQALVRIRASGDVLGDCHGPFVVEIRAGLCVLTDHVPGLASIVRERELTGTTTVASLGQTLGWGELLVVRDFKVPEADWDHLAGLVGRHGSLLVTTCGFLFSYFEADVSTTVNGGGMFS